MKFSLGVLSLFFGLCLSARATVTLNFSQPFAGDIASNFANAGGTPTNGMEWGIVVETSTTSTNFGSSGAGYSAYAADVTTTSGFLSVAGTATGDYYTPGGKTSTSTGFTESGGGGAGGNGTIYSSGPISLSINGEGGVIAPGEKFALVWFSTNSGSAGSAYGFFTDPSFVVPASDGTYNFDGAFAGTDPIRAASNTFVAAAPEPSRLLLLLLGAVGLIVRRRRQVVA